MRPRFFFILAAIESLVCTVYLLLMPADPKNVILLGYSARRLVVIGVVLLLFGFFGALAWLVRPNQWLEWLRKRPSLLGWAIFLSSFFFILGWIVVFTPSYRFHPYHLIFKNLLPVIVLITLLNFQTALWLMVIRYGFAWENLKTALKDQRRLMWSAAIVYLILLLGWGFIALTRLGLTPDIAFWNTVGVPLLCPLTIVGWAVGMLLLFLGRVTQSQSTDKPEKPSSIGRWILGLPHWQVDSIIALGIFLFTSVLWLVQPIQPTFFAPGPSLPNHEIYPYSDAAGYDLAAQLALIGQGLMGGNAADKPLYSAFLFILHLLAGQNYTLLTGLQAFALALMPVVVFFLTKLLTDRIGGLVASLLVSFKIATAISSAGLILYANPRLLLSELPTAVGLLFFTLWVMRWAKNPDHGWHYLALAGGTTGLLTLVRHNTWILLILMLAMAFWQDRRRPGRACLSALFFTGALVISILPWMWRSYQTTGSPWYFLGTLRSVILDTRYELIEPTGGLFNESGYKFYPKTIRRGSGSGAAGSFPTAANSSDLCGDLDSRIPLPAGRYDERQEEILYCGQWKAIKKQPAYLRTLRISSNPGDSVYLKFQGDQISIHYLKFEKGGKLDIFIDGNFIEQLDTYQAGEATYQVPWDSPRLKTTSSREHLLKLVHAGGGSVALDGFIIQNEPTAELFANISRTVRAGASFVPQHFFHNLVTTILILPTSLINDDIDHLVKSKNSPWLNSWDGNLPLGQAILLAVNMAILAIGLAYAWSRHRLSGFIPLFVYLLYNLATAVARTSGGRYVSPIDWVILVYYAAGMLQLSRLAVTPLGFSSSPSQAPLQISPVRRKSWKNILGIPAILAGFLLAGSLPLIVETVPSPLYPVLSMEQKIEMLAEREIPSLTGIGLEELRQFSTQPNAVIGYGRALYPRFNYMNKGEPGLRGAYRILGFPRLSFTWIGPEGFAGVVLPAAGDDAYPSYFPHAVDVIVIGCFNGEYIDAFLVQVKGKETAAYLRSPSAPLNCPFPEPVCENDDTCR